MKLSPILLVSILILPLLVSPNPSTQQQIDLDVDTFIETIIQKLDQHKYLEDGKLFGWLYRYDSNFRYDLVYNGHTMGSAGIGDFLVKAYINGFEDALPLTNEIVAHFANSAQVSIENHTYWPRFSNLASEGWTAYRYGSAGILEFLANAKKAGIENITDSMLEYGVNWMMASEKDGYWPIAEDGYITTGLEYGGAGIGYSLLKLHQLTGNEFYLNSSIILADYLIDLIIFEGDLARLSWTPALDEEFLGERFSGIGVGEAGVMEYFNELYLETNDESYLDVAVGFAKDLLTLDLGGYWTKGTVGYINTYPGDSTGMIGFLVGATGTSYELLEFYKSHGGSNYLESAMSTVEFVEPYLDYDGSVVAGQNYEDYKLTGYGLGSAGVANYFLELYKYTNDPLHYGYAERILVHLYDLIQEHGLVPIDEYDLELGYSFNIEDGLAGIGLTLLNFKNTTPPDVKHTFPDPPTETTTSNRRPSSDTESTIGVTPLSPILLLIMLPITAFFTRSKTKFGIDL